MRAIKRGPKPKTIESAGHHARAEDWEPPAHLTGEAKEAWEHIVGLVRRTGNLGRCDPILCEIYAINVWLLRKAHAALAAEGLTTRRGSGALAEHPAIGIINSASMRIKGLAHDLGLTPASSQYAASSTTAGAGKWDELLGFKNDDTEFEAILSLEN